MTGADRMYVAAWGLLTIAHTSVTAPAEGIAAGANFLAGVLCLVGGVWALTKSQP